jgi:LuxR family transcriptional regulator, maltose regulon positive regulatory protein
MNKDEGHLIHEKLMIPDKDSLIARPRLLSLLIEGLEARAATIINGRAATGKTTLAAGCARGCGRSVAWYKVDAADSELPVFLSYLLEAVRLQNPQFDHEALQRQAESITHSRIYQLAESFVFQLTQAVCQPLLIVIEDLHLIYDTDWVVPFLWRVMPLLPADVHLLVTCRSLPPTPLWRMRSKQTLLVIDEPELAFNLDETIEWFKRRGLDRRRAQFALNQTNGRVGALSDFIDRACSGQTATRDFQLRLGVVA